MSSTALSLILEKISNKDKDFRYMATSDLVAELSKNTFKTDADTETRLCDATLKQLEDASGDVSSLAVKCLGLLVHKVAEARVEKMLDELCTKLISAKKDQQRDIVSIGLKTMVGEIQGGTLATAAVKRLVPKLIEGIQDKEHFDVRNESLDITNEVLSKFGGQMTNSHKVLTDSLLPVLDENHSALRKRAIQCIASLSVYLNDELLGGVVDHVIAGLQSPQSTEGVRTYAQCIGAISRSIGYRFGKQLDRAVPLMVRHCREAAEADDEVREYCLQALESFVLRSSHEARGHLDVILPLSLQYMAWDPNYADDMEDEADDEDGGDEDEELSNSEYSDDEDSSWKVRRAASKTLAAIINHYPDLLNELYPKVAPALIIRFREREENVKTDVFNAFVDLLRQVDVVASRFDGDRGQGPLKQLEADVGALVKACSRQLRDKSLKTKIGVFQVLRELVAVLPDSIQADISQLVPGIQAALADKSSSSSSLKIQALLFLRLAMSSTDPSVFQPHIKSLSASVFAAAGERYYKVTAEALHVCEEMVRIIKPDAGGPVDPSLKDVVKPMFEAVNKRLSAQDQDQEVKDAAISCMATIVSSVGDQLASAVPQVLKVLLDRLRNEITRLATVKAFAVIASSPLGLDLSPILEPVITDITSFLRKSNRLLRQASLTALEAVVAEYGKAVEPALLTNLVEEAATLTNYGDLMVATLSLNLTVELLQRQPSVGPMVLEKVLPQAMGLAKSPLLQGGALQALQGFYTALVLCKPAGVSFDSVFQSLLAAGQSEDLGKTGQTSIAQCIAVLCANAGTKQVNSTVKAASIWRNNQAATALSKPSMVLQGEGTDAPQRLALLALGALESDSKSEEVKSAASLALGGVAIGNLGTYLPFIMAQIRGQAGSPKQQYLLLKALNEVIVSLATIGDGSKQLAQGQEQEVLQLLLSNCESEEECRNVVAECLGHLALLHPDTVLPRLRAHAADTAPNMRTIIVTAVKSMALDRPHPIDTPLRACIGTFLLGIKDEDRHVRKAAVQALSGAAHAKAGLVAEQLPALLPLVYQQTVVNEALIRTVDLGPFKHQIDDGLELRKAAFECLDTLLDKCPDAINFPEFIQHLESGLVDHYDVKMPCHLLLGKLAAVAGGHVLAALDRLVDPLHKTLTAKLKSDAVKQEVDRNEDMIRGCLRAIEAINHIPDVDTCTPFKTFMANVVLREPMSLKYNAVKEERAEAEGVDAMDIG